MPFANAVPGFARAVDTPIYPGNPGPTFQQTVNNAATVTLPLTDITRYSSFRFNISSSSNGTPALAYVDVKFLWFVQTSPTVFTQVEEEIICVAGNNNITMGHGICRGTHLRIALHNYDSVSTVVSFNMLGSIAQETRMQFHTQGTLPSSGLLFTISQSILANGQFVSPPIFWNGPVLIKMLCATLPTAIKKIEVIFNPQPISTFADIKQLEYFIPQTLDITSPLIVQSAFPRRAMICTINNNDTNTNTVNVDVYGTEL